LTLYTDGSVYAGEWQGVSTVVGKWYKTQIVVTTGSPSLQFRVGTSGGASDVLASTNFMTTAGTYTFYFLAVGTTSYVYVRSGSNGTSVIRSISTKNIAGNHRYQPTSANRPTWSARYNLLLDTASLSTQSVTTVATNYVLYFTGSGTVTLSGTSTGTLSAGSNTITCTAGTLTLTVSGSVLTADLRPANQAVGLLPQYQAVVTPSNYDSVGFPAGLRWNGSNSWMQNASVDFSGTNKVSVFVGVRKQSDAAAGVVCETSTAPNSTNGSISLQAPTGAATNYGYYSRGTSQQGVTPTPYVSPITNVISAQSDISSPSMSMRINGVAAGSTGATQGTGNFGNYPAYFGARAGSSLFFNGLTFSNIAIGIALSASQIAAFEAWTNSRTKAYA